MKPEKVQLNDKSFIGGVLTIKTFKDGMLIRESAPMRNKFVSSTGYGRNLVLRAMAGDTTYPIVITSASLGTGTTTPTDSDTALATSTVSGLGITNMVVSNDSLQVDVFVPDASLANGTYKEFGLFATLRLLSRVLITPNYTKAAGEDTLLSYTLQITG